MPHGGLRGWRKHLAEGRAISEKPCLLSDNKGHGFHKCLFWHTLSGVQAKEIQKQMGEFIDRVRTHYC